MPCADVEESVREARQRKGFNIFYFRIDGVNIVRGIYEYGGIIFRDFASEFRLCFESFLAVFDEARFLEQFVGSNIRVERNVESGVEAL